MFIITAHAVEQYCSRIDRNLSHGDAERELQDAMGRANRLKERTPKGDTMWQLHNGVRVVTKRDGSNDIVVTVLPAERLSRRASRRLNDRTLPEDEE